MGHVNRKENDIGIPHRRSIRLKDYDYAGAGAYFITVCTLYRECLFGDVLNGEMRLNRFGLAVREEWLRTSEMRQGVETDAFVVMPNHVHGVILITDGAGTARRAPTDERFGIPVCGSVPTLVRALKSAWTRRINQARNTPGALVWQRNFHEHVIRGENELDRLRQYITDNPGRWEEDDNHPTRLKQA